MKKNSNHRTLSPEERALWEKVKQTAQPLDREPVSLVEYLSVNKIPLGASEKKATPNTHTPSERNIIRSHRSNSKNKPWSFEAHREDQANRIEQNTTRKIAKGRIAIDGKIDLHGQTQIEAHGKLFRYLEEAWMREKRTILVITGKGKGEGILRQAVPRWLSEASFRAMISGVSEAHQNHGGYGALYIRLKRRRKLL